METYAEFKMCGPAATQLLSQLPTRGPGWYRDPGYDAGKNAKSIGSKQISVRTDHGPTYPAVRIAFVIEDADCYTVSNVVQVAVADLTVTQHNQALRDFYDAHVRSHEGPDLDTAPPRGERDLSEYLDERGISLLRQFSANMSSGASHPQDFQRWAMFVSHTFKTGTVLSNSVLREALIELEWPEEIADDLADEYETYIDLLAVHETGALYSGNDE